MVTWQDFEGRHAGETVWVLGSGKTLDFVDRTFFDGKTVVAANHSWKGKADHAYVCSNHWGVDAPGWLVLPEVEPVPVQDRFRGERPSGDRLLFVPTIQQQYANFRPADHWPEPGRFAVGPSSATIAVDWAVFLGAAHIVLVGFDCGVIDSAERLDGYYPPVNDDAVAQHSHHALWERVMNETAVLLRSRGISVHSLNPWATLGLEGHSWEQRR
ncbi:MAG TPA: hypothetical protein VIG24_07930 [Acidimicrobiia bacterium]